MKRALVTFGVGEHAELLEIALPSFERYAAAHGCDLVVTDPEPRDRPPSWWKLPALEKALGAFDEALWVDADVVIVDASQRVPCPRGAWQAMVEHHTGDGAVPNLGVWLVRRPMLPVLAELWQRTEYVEHPWWEQAAMLDLLGYRHQPRPSVLVAPTALHARTHFLNPGWNVHRSDTAAPLRPRFLHATTHPDRAAVMRGWAETREVALCAS